jgi:hypothetical protein
MSYNFSINSSEDNICYVSTFNNHRSILLLKNTSTIDVILKNANINLNYKNNKKENLIVIWKLILNPVTNIVPTWIGPQTNSVVQHSSQVLTITSNANTQILLSGYINETLTINLDDVLNNKKINQNDIIALTLEYVGTTISTQNPSVGALGSISWSEGATVASGSDSLMIAALNNIDTSTSNIDTSTANIDTSNAAIQTAVENIETSNAAIQTSISNLETMNTAMQLSLSNLETLNTAMKALLISIDESNTLIAANTAP